MTGPEHFQAAQALLDLAEAEPEASDLTAYYVAAAQVHATLAHAAATAMTASELGADGETGLQWRRLIVAKRPSPIRVPS